MVETAVGGATGGGGELSSNNEQPPPLPFIVDVGWWRSFRLSRYEGVGSNSDMWLDRLNEAAAAAAAVAACGGVIGGGGCDDDDDAVESNLCVVEHEVRG